MGTTIKKTFIEEIVKNMYLARLQRLKWSLHEFTVYPEYTHIFWATLEPEKSEKSKSFSVFITKCLSQAMMKWLIFPWRRILKADKYRTFYR